MILSWSIYVQLTLSLKWAIKSSQRRTKWKIEYTYILVLRICTSMSSHCWIQCCNGGSLHCLATFGVSEDFDLSGYNVFWNLKEGLARRYLRMLGSMNHYGASPVPQIREDEIIIHQLYWLMEKIKPTWCFAEFCIFNIILYFFIKVICSR